MSVKSLVIPFINEIGHLVGLIGTAFIVFAYYAIENGKYSQNDVKYYVVNLTGAILLIISLTIHFNLGSFIIELFWIAISFRGILRILKRL